MNVIVFVALAPGLKIGLDQDCHRHNLFALHMSPEVSGKFYTLISICSQIENSYTFDDQISNNATV